MCEIKITTNSSLETYDVGVIISNLLKSGSVVALYGDLAAGKTCLSRGIFEAKGFKEGFSSPTFTIINEYGANGKIGCHIDAYRIDDLCELDYIGYFDYLSEADITVIEWADIIEEYLPTNTVRIYLYNTDKDDKRDIIIKLPDKTLYGMFKEKLHAYIGD